MGALIGIDLDRAADLLMQGKLVAIPTETVYGLAANGLNTEAAAGIFAAKKPTYIRPPHLACWEYSAGQIIVFGLAGGRRKIGISLLARPADHGFTQSESHPRFGHFRPPNCSDSNA